MAQKAKIQNGDDFLKWLEGKPDQWTSAISARIFLRILPLAGLGDTVGPLGAGETMWRANFRAALILWVANRYSTLNIVEVNAAAAAARRSIDRVLQTFGGAAYRAASAALATTQRDTLLHSYAVAAASDAARAAGRQGSKIWSSIEADAAWLLNNEAPDAPQKLMAKRLWLQEVRGDPKYKVNLPQWIRSDWDKFKASENVKGLGFEIWTKWYDRRLIGSRSVGLGNLNATDSERLETRVAGQPDQFWNRSVGQVNEVIRKWASETTKPALYNLIVSGSVNAWSNRSGAMPLNRFLEHTDKAVAKEFVTLGPQALDRLLALPTLFAYEMPVEMDAHVGRLTALRVSNEGMIEFNFELDRTLPPIPYALISQNLDRFGISNLEQYRTHWALKQIDIESLLSDLQIEPAEQADAEETEIPPEPPAGPGPQYSLIAGRLSEVPSPPDPTEHQQQSSLHNELRREANSLAKAVERIANNYPELASAVKVYAELVNSGSNSIDVVGVWSVGGSLAAFAQSYREQNVNRTLAEPLEPQVEAILQSVVRQHGAFILGFKEGRDLVHRADEFAVDGARLKEIEPSGNILLNEVTENHRLIDHRTRSLHRPIRDGVTQFGWQSSRLGFSAYVVVRNSFRAIIKFGLGADPSLGSALGLLAGLSTMAGDPSMEFMRAALSALQQNGPQLIAFFSHSPEMRAYIEWALKVLEDDRQRSQQS